MFCFVLLVFSLFQLTPALPVYQKHLLSCCESADLMNNCLNTIKESETEADAEMATGDLEPTHFPARRAAKVALHYINTQHGSPFKVFGLQTVHKARAEAVETGGRKYNLDFSVINWANEGSGLLSCTAEVFFPQNGPPEVQYNCDGLQKVNFTSEETDFLQKYREPESPLTAQYIPDSYGNMTDEMKPFWHLARVAASFIMLRESSEKTELNMAQVANITQQVTHENELKLNYYVLLHDMPSQEIIHWKLLMSWSPDGGVRVLNSEWQPKCPHDVPPNDNNTEPVSN